MINRFSIVTLVIFIFSIFFVIQPISIPLRYSRRKHINVPLNLTTAPILAIAILWAAQCLDPAVIRDGIVGTDGIKPYNILILFFSLAYMAITLDITGVLQAAAFWVSNRGGSNGWKLYFYFYVMLTLLSILLGNDPVILSGTAFLVYYTSATGLKPIPWLFSEFAAANTASMVLFVGNPTNVVICEGFAINNVAFSAYTILPFLACNIACYGALAFQFRDPKHIPKRLDRTGKLDVRSVLLDPVGAWVGSILLGTCLIVIIIVSFFNVDVWKISLPFAVAKFGYDFAWDHYRHVNGMLGRGNGQSASSGEPVAAIIKRSMTQPTRSSTATTFQPPTHTDTIKSTAISNSPPSPASTVLPVTAEPKSESTPNLFVSQRESLGNLHDKLSSHFPTFFTALPRLPFALVPFAFSQFILIEALEHQGWIDVFARWLIHATHRQIYPTVWIIGVLGVILCNVAGTNIGATILLTKIVRAAPEFPPHSSRAAAIALAVASNIGAVSFTFSASLAGLLWRTILRQKGIHIAQWQFALYNLLPLAVMTTVGLAVVSAEMAVLF